MESPGGIQAQYHGVQGFVGEADMQPTPRGPCLDSGVRREPRAHLREPLFGLRFCAHWKNLRTRLEASSVAGRHGPETEQAQNPWPLDLCGSRGMILSRAASSTALGVFKSVAGGLGSYVRHRRISPGKFFRVTLAHERPHEKVYPKLTEIDGERSDPQNQHVRELSLGDSKRLFGGPLKAVTRVRIP